VGIDVEISWENGIGRGFPGAGAGPKLVANLELKGSCPFAPVIQP